MRASRVVLAYGWAIALGSGLGCNPPAAHVPAAASTVAPKSAPTSAVGPAPVLAGQGAIAVAGAAGAGPRFIVGDPAFVACAQTEALAFSADGATLLAGGQNGSVVLVDAATGAVRARLAGPKIPDVDGYYNAIEQIRVAGTVFATVDRSGHVVLWRSGAKGLLDATGTLLSVKVADDESGSEVSALELSRSGDALLVKYKGGTPVVWDVAKGAARATLATAKLGSMGPFEYVFSPDGAVIAASGWSDGVTVFAADTGAVKLRSDEIAGQLGSLEEVVATAGGFVGLKIERRDKPSAEAQVVRLDTAGKLVSKTAVRIGAIDRAALSRDGAVLALAQEGRVRVVSAETGEERISVKPFGASERGLNGMVFSPDGAKLLVTAGTQANVIDAATGKLAREPSPGRLGPVRTMAFAASVLAIVDDTRTRVVPLDGSGSAVDVALEAEYALAMAPDGRGFVGLGDELFRVDLATREVLWERTGKASESGPRAMVASPDLGLVAYGSRDGKIVVLDGKTGERVREIATECGDISNLLQRASPAPSGAVGCRAEKAFTMFDLATGKDAGSLPIPGRWVYAAGRALAVSDAPSDHGQQLALFDLATGAEKARFDHGDVVAMSPQGSWVARSDVASGELILRDMASGTERRTARPGVPILGLASDPAGEMLAVGSLGFVEVWSVRDLMGGAP